MLVLTRRPGESIMIGDGIKLTVVNLGPGRVKIGIEAPANVRIDREEIYSRIQQEQKAEQVNLEPQEHSSDVLESLSREAITDQSLHNTIVASASETSVLHNRIASKLPAETPLPSPTGSSSGSTPGISKYRGIRKPR